MPRTATTATAAVTPNVTSGLRALSDIAWMARRQASRPAGQEHAAAFNDANWLLHDMARREHISMGHPDPTANRDYDEALARMSEVPSYYTDGAPTDYEPTTEQAEELRSLDRAEAVQWIVAIMHPLAHPYADGAATYAPGMLNDATRVLRSAGFDLSATEALGKSVWVTDGMGDGFLRLSRTEIAERDEARARHA